MRAERTITCLLLFILLHPSSVTPSFGSSSSKPLRKTSSGPKTGPSARKYHDFSPAANKRWKGQANRSLKSKCGKGKQDCETLSPSSDTSMTASPSLEPSTPAPVTPAPTTPAPVTPAPVTPIPTTSSPVTPAPITFPPVTSAPVTALPATASPVTSAPITQAPISPAPITPAPFTQAPTTTAPVTPAPVTLAPTVTATDPPVSASPVTAAPVTAVPSNAPVTTEAPVSPATPAPTPLPTLSPSEDGDQAGTLLSCGSIAGTSSVSVNYLYTLEVVSPSVDVAATLEKIESDVLNAAATLLSCRRRRSLQQSSLVGLSSAPADVPSGSCGATCTDVVGGMTAYATDDGSAVDHTPLVCDMINAIRNRMDATESSVPEIRQISFIEDTRINCDQFQDAGDGLPGGAVNSSQDDSAGGISVGGIVGIAIASTLVLVVIFFATRRYRRLRDGSHGSYVRALDGDKDQDMASVGTKETAGFTPSKASPDQGDISENPTFEEIEDGVVSDTELGYVPQFEPSLDAANASENQAASTIYISDEEACIPEAHENKNVGFWGAVGLKSSQHEDTDAGWRNRSGLSREFDGIYCDSEAGPSAKASASTDNGQITRDNATRVRPRRDYVFPLVRKVAIQKPHRPAQEKKSAPLGGLFSFVFDREKDSRADSEASSTESGSWPGSMASSTDSNDGADNLKKRKQSGRDRSMFAGFLARLGVMGGGIKLGAGGSAATFTEEVPESDDSSEDTDDGITFYVPRKERSSLGIDAAPTVRGWGKGYEEKPAGLFSSTIDLGTLDAGQYSSANDREYRPKSTSRVPRTKRRSKQQPRLMTMMAAIPESTEVDGDDVTPSVEIESSRSQQKLVAL